MAPSPVLYTLTVLALLCTSSFAQTNFSGSVLSCPSLAAATDDDPATVHRLRPSDISVIGAMGNSITAGFGVLLNNLTELSDNPTDFRGLSWSGGGDLSLEYITTLPNILRQYNPNLYGYSTETTPTSDFIDLPNTRLNVARTGAHASEMLQQAEDLVAKIRASDQVDFENDWKLITVFIGSNDICQLPCIDDPLGEPENWIRNITTALDYLSDNLPRTFVNLIQMTNLTFFMRQVLTNTGYGSVCAGLYRSLVCDCGPFESPLFEDTFTETLLQYMENLKELAGSGRYDVSDTFTVVLQPFQMTTVLNTIDGEADLSPLTPDCSHLRPEGNRDLAVGLWNNMFERVGEKTSTLRLPNTELICPTNEQPFLFTSLNSVSGTPSLAISLNPGLLVTVGMILVIIMSSN